MSNDRAARAALLTLVGPDRNAEVWSDLKASRKHINLALAIDGLGRWAWWIERCRQDQIRRVRTAKLRRANRRRGPASSYLAVSPWMWDPLAGRPYVQARHWALLDLECARVPRRLRRRLLDLVEQWQASRTTATSSAL